MAAFSHFAPFHSGGSAFLDLLFPNICSVCGQENFYSRDPVCAGCDDQWIPMDLKNRVQELAVRENIDRAYTGWEFGPELRALIHPLKYQDRARIGSYLGRRLGRRVKEKMNLELDALIPVPLHPVKYRERGYNQAQWICRGLSRELQLPMWPKAITRVKYTISQTTLDREERQNNMQQAFHTRKDMAGKTIAVIDDVLTTGSTISSLAGTIKDAGAKTVVALTVAAPLDHLDDSFPESL